MDELARIPSNDRGDLFRAAAEQLGVAPRIIEKDFWVCWVLRRLFTLEHAPAGLLFKGGTSLSKVYKAINRFSEDVDLSFNRTDLGFPGVDELLALSRKKRDTTLENLSTRCRDIVRGEYLRQLHASFDAALAGSAGAWTLSVGTEEQDGQTLLFRYPAALEPGTGAAYIADVVRLEFGARSDHWPLEERTLTPYAAESHPRQFRDALVPVRVLSAERTFWEKATILHMWHHAPADKPFRDRQSRHYYDLAMLARHEIGERALTDTDLLTQVAKHKSVFFQSGWAGYETAKPGSLRLLPRPERLDALRTDYELMRREMLFADPPSFETVVRVLTELEAAINR